MGVFDYVNYSANCKNCGEPLTNFQTKSGKCMFEVTEPKEVDDFYAYCDKCKTLNTFKVDRVRTVVVMKTKSKEKVLTFDTIESVACTYECKLTDDDVKPLGYESVEEYAADENLPWTDGFDVELVATEPLEIEDSFNFWVPLKD